MTRTSAIAVFLLVTATGFPAIAAPGQDGAAPRAQTRPRIDPLTAVIRGRVTAAGTGAPVRRAEVRAMVDGGVSRLATTDADGHYELRDLPAGRFMLTVARTGFVPLRFGQRRPTEAPAPITLTAGESFTADVALPRGGAIIGRVHDERGDPVANVRVQALRSRMVEGRRRHQAVGAGDRTDDTGAFRLFGLAPGDYYVAVSGGGPEQAPGSRIKARVPTYYPGTPILEEAQRVTLGLGAEASANVQLLPVRTANVSGIVLNAAGAPAQAMVNLTSEAVSLGYVNAMGAAPLTIGGHADTAADGAFTLSDVPPGTYTLSASIFGRTGQLIDGRPVRTVQSPLPEGHETASLAIVVGGDNVTGLTIVTGSGASLTGTFVRDVGVVQPLPRGLVAEARQMQSGGINLRRTQPNGEFTVAGMTGPFHLGIEGLPADWAVKAILVDGTDVTDSLIDLKGDNAEVRVVLTDRVTALTGIVTARDSRQPSVVIFPEDAAKWTYPSRYVRTVRADEQGAFAVSGLPGGTRYRALALDSLDEGDTDDPEFLAAIRDRATSFTLEEGERKAIELRTILP